MFHQTPCVPGFEAFLEGRVGKQPVGTCLAHPGSENEENGPLVSSASTA